MGINFETIKERFSDVGHEIEFVERPRIASDWMVDVKKRDNQEIFMFEVKNLDSPDLDLNVIDVNKDIKHLLLHVKNGKLKDKILFGKDERGLFVAPLPVNSPATNIRTSFESLKPNEVIKSEKGVKTKDKMRRKNEKRVRQGEWFFVPVLNESLLVKLDKEKIVHRKESLQRERRSKPHIAEYCVRYGGKKVYSLDFGRTWISESQKKMAISRDKTFSQRVIGPRMEDAEVYVKGRISHPDHKTIVLKTWHRVFQNTEIKSRIKSNLRFID